MEKERERNINVWLPLVYPLLGTWPATQACALTGNWTHDPLRSIHRAQSTEPHQPGLKDEILNTQKHLILNAGWALESPVEFI